MPLDFSDLTPKPEAAPAKPDYTAEIAEAGDAHDVDPLLLHALVDQESNGDRFAESSAHAKGLTQLMDGTAAEMGVRDVYAPRDNLHGGAKYLRQMIDRFHGDPYLALAAYNAGPGGNLEGSMGYAHSVLDRYDALRQQRWNQPQRQQPQQQRKPLTFDDLVPAEKRPPVVFDDLIPKAGEAATPPPPIDEPGYLGAATQALTHGLRSGAQSVQQTATGPFTDRAKEPEDNSYVARQLRKPISEGWSDPKWWTTHIVSGFAESAPSLAAGVAGGAAGAVTAGPVGGLIGGAGGFALGSALQTLGPAYLKARAENLSHDEAVDRAIKETGVAAGFGAAMGLVPGVSFFGRTVEGALKRPISEALAQIFVAQPGLGAGQQVATGAVEGKMPTADELATGYATNVGMGAGVTGVHKGVEAAAHALRPAASPEFQRATETLRQTAQGQPTEPAQPAAAPGAPPGTVRTPEATALQDLEAEAAATQQAQPAPRQPPPTQAPAQAPELPPTPHPAPSPVQPAPPQAYPSPEGLPPVPAGQVRLYHGGDNPDSGGGRWVTPDYAYARDYRPGQSVHYVDVPVDHPDVQRALEPGRAAVEGTNMAAPISTFEAPEDIAKQMKPVAEPPRREPVPEPPPTTVTPEPTEQTAPPGPSPDELRTRRLAIADEWEALDPKMAKAIRAGARLGDTTPEQIAFLEQRLAEKKAQVDPNAPPPPKPQEKFDLDQFMQRSGRWKQFDDAASPEAKELAAETQRTAQLLTDRINDLGLTTDRAHIGSQQGADLKNQLGGLLGTFNRYMNNEVAVRKGYQGASEAKLADARRELLKVLRPGEEVPEAPPTPAQDVRAPAPEAPPPVEEPAQTPAQTSLEKPPSFPESPQTTPSESAPTGERPANVPEAPPARPADYGANNTMFTADMAAKARERLRAKMAQLNTGFDPEMMLDGLTLAGYHIEAGARSFANFAKAMLDDLGDGIRPFLAHLYNSVREYPGFDARDMEDREAVARQHAALPEEGTDATGPRPTDLGEPGDRPAPQGGLDTGQSEGAEHPETVAPGAPEDVSGVRGGVPEEAGVRPGRGEAGGENPVSEGGVSSDGRGGAGDQGVAPAGAGGRPPEPDPVRPNYHIDDPERLIGGTPKVRFTRNRSAIEALHAIDEMQRAPTAEELDAMAGYIGWGSFGQDLFQGTWERPVVRRGWEAENQWLRDHLGEEGWKSAQRSIINAHYTDPPTVQAMWDMARAMGFKGGRVLEPSMGIGNFFGMMPRDIMAASNLTGIELDRTTAKMAKHLYPEAGVHQKGYQESRTPDNFYDMVIGNWPFAEVAPADRRYAKLSPTLHDFFFLKALDQTRPGGLVMGITSAGTMDKVSRATRAELAKKGDLIAAFRFPTGAFEKYAGTAVVTDLLVFRKRGEGEPPADAPWLDSSDMRTPSGGDIRVNRFFQEHPENVLGTLDWDTHTTIGRPGMVVRRPEDLMERLQGLASRVPADGYRPKVRGSEPRFITNNVADRQNSIVIGQDGNLYQVQGERLARVDDIAKQMKSGTPAERAKRTDQVKQMVGLRKSYGALMDAERDGSPQVEDLRKTLNDGYQAFRKKHGPINDSAGIKVMDRLQDPAADALRALETPDGKPSRVLTEPTVRARRAMENPSVSDAYILARNEAKILDLDRIAELAKIPREQVEQELLTSGAVFRTPGNGFEPADSYLSGNVRRKLREAQDAVERGENMQASVDALTKALPPDVPYYNIEAKLGAPWVGDSTYRDFVGHMLSLSDRDLDNVHVRFAGSRWRVSFSSDRLRHRVEARSNFGTEEYPFHKLVEKAMGNETVKITRTDSDGNKYVDEEATKEVNEKIARMRDAFADWAWSDPERKLAMEHNYNETMNAIAKPKYDGSFMDMAGMALRRGTDPFALRQHQTNAIWRGVLLGRGLFAHEVGTGKTYTLGGIAVEGRRYGQHSKPLIFAHNANSEAVYQGIREMYPGAKLLYVDNLSPNTIGSTLHRIANDDWDAIVMPHSLIDRMALSRETLMELAQDQIRDLENEAMEAAREDGANLTPEMMDDPKAMGSVRSVTAKQLVKQRERIIANIEKQAQRAAREGAVPFEQLGVDALMVDEAHEFKKPPIVTRMKLKGLNTQTSDRSIALNFLTGYVKKQNNGKGTYLFTGTPLTNALNEAFNMARYFMDDQMGRDGIGDWDTWFNTFAGAEPDIEYTATGSIEPTTRLNQFANIDELVRQMSEFTDVVQAKDMPEFKPRATPDGKTFQSPDLTPKERDFLENGRTDNAEGRPYKKVVSDLGAMTPHQQEILGYQRGLAQEWKDASKKQRRDWMLSGDEHNPVLVETNIANASLDARLYDPTAPDDPNSKVNRTVRNVLDTYKEPKAAQMIFVDRGYAPVKSSEGMAERFVMVNEMVDKLVAGGIPRNEIAIIKGGTKPEQKSEIAKAMNTGKVRVAIGQSGTMGVGVNAQVLLRAMHHMDAPWMPGELEQRNGRGERQGNTWNTVKEFRYITEGIDVKRWQVLGAKDRFIKQFISAFNDDTGKRIGTIEGDVADISDEGDIVKSLSDAAGDPRITVRAKLGADVTRLEKRERQHTIGVADARQKARQMRQMLVEQNAKKEAETQQFAVWDQAAQRADAAAKAVGETKRTYETDIGGQQPRTGEEIQAALDDQVRQLVRGEVGKVLGTINGHRIIADWRGNNPEPSYRIAAGDAPAHALLASPTMQRIIGAVTALRNRVHAGPTDFEQRAAKLEEAGKQEFPQAAQLAKKKQQLAELETDLQENPQPPPGWLRHGAMVDSDIYVDGQPRVVRGHKVTDDYYVVTDEGDVPYQEAKDAGGQRIYDVHPPPEQVAAETAEAAARKAGGGFAPGDRVTYGKGQVGTIERIVGTGADQHVIIKTDSGMTTDLPMRMAGMTRIEEGRASLRPEGAPEGEAREPAPLEGLMRGIMRYAGLPDTVGLKLVDKLRHAATGKTADATITKDLLTFALNTPADQVPAKLFHEIIHGLMDSVLSPRERRALEVAGERYLREGRNRAELAAQYGSDPQTLREEAIARLAEQALARARDPGSLVQRAGDAMVRTVQGLGQALRGQGFKTADDVFRSIMQGERAPPGSRVGLAMANMGAEHQVSPEPTEQTGEGKAALRPPPLPPGQPGRPELLRDKKGLARLGAEIRALFSPTSLMGAKPTEQAIRDVGSQKQRAFDQAVHKLEQVRNAVDRLSTQEQIDFTDRAERGLPQATPELQAVNGVLRGLLDDWAQQIQGLGRGYLANAIEHYMGRAYKNYNEWSRGLPDADRASGPDFAKKPLLGSAAFLKRRIFPTQKDAISAGLEPVTYNPVDMQVIKLREMQNFYYGTKLADRMKDVGIARWVPAGQEKAAGAEGWVQLDDRVFQPRLPGSQHGAFGRIEPGNWMAPEPAARLLNNYLSRGLAGQSLIYDTFRVAGNALNMLQLGLSGFHATFVALDTMISTVALGLQQIGRGAIGKGVANVLLGTTPLAAVRAIREGSRLRAGWLDLAHATPADRQLAQWLNTGGGQYTMPGFYRTNASGSFFKTWADLKHPGSVFGQVAQMFRDASSPAEKALAVPLKVAGRLLETINEPLMGQVVPRAKAGVFSALAKDWVQAHPNATPEQRAAALIKFQDSVDNRLGQLRYDNVFWNKTMKDMAFVTMRSVGWNLGTVREIAGGVVDSGKFMADVARLRAPQFSTRMAYSMAMPAVTMLYGAILTYLATGKGPQSLLDYFFPPTGGQDESGEPERRIIPGYMKDVIEYAKAPIQTVLNKVNPLVEALIELKQNKDYYGGIIYDPARDPNRAASYADYLLNQSIPFSWRGYAKLHQQQAPMLDQMLSFWGIQPAPQSIVHPEVGEHFQAVEDKKGYRRRMKEETRQGRIHLFTE